MSATGAMKISNIPGPGTGGEFEPPDAFRQGAERRARAGLLVFLAVVTSLFFLMILAFMIRSQFTDWEHLSAPWQPLAHPWQLWINTAMLVLASLALQWARVASRRGNLRTVRESLLLAGGFTIGFLFGQLWIWRQFAAAGYFASANPANAFFYLLTGIHGLHLAGGLVAWGRIMARPVEQSATAIKLCSLYWHYLLALWLVLFALLTASPEAFAAFAALCGFQTL